MKKLLFVLAALAAMSFIATSTASAGIWPAHCKTMKCVNKHLNALHKTAKANAARDKALTRVVTDLLDTNPPTNNVLQGEIDQLQNVDQGQNGDINNLFNQPAINGCWQDLAFGRFHPSDGTPYTQFGQGGGFPAYGPAFDGYFDLRHTGEPDNTFVYRLVWDACNSG